MKATVMFTILGLGLSLLASAQKEELKDFDYLVKKIRTDYPGYHDKVNASTEKDLLALEMKLRKKITEHPDSIGTYLDAYASWFRDNHMFVGNKRDEEPSAAGNAEKNAAQFHAISKDVLSDLAQRNSSVEGIWVSFSGTIAVTRIQGEDKYLGTAIACSHYEPDQILFELIPVNDSQFTMKCYPYWNDFRPMKGKASLHMRDKVLEIHNDTRFVRQSASPAFDKALLYSYRAEFPNGVNIYPLATSLDDSTFYLRITSFMDDAGNKCVKAHWNEIMARPNLIIDIRGNGGGQDEYYQMLSALVYTNPYPSRGVEWYASEGNIRCMEDALKSGEVKNGEEGIQWVRELIDVMKKNPGGFVMHPSTGRDGIEKEDTVYKNPRRVGIIINEGNGSSAEQFILEAKESKKVRLFGNHNTAGVLDYSNRIQEDLPSGKYEFYWPMTRSRRLPEHPIDNIGIPPDVIIPYPETKQLYDRIDDWVYFVKAYLEN